MSYFGGSSRLAGDPGLFDVFKTVFGVGKRIVKTAFQGSPVGQAISVLGGFQQPTFVAPPPRAGGRIPAIPAPHVQSMQPRSFVVDPRTGMPRARRRRINYANPKALRRATRRTEGFVRLAKSAMKDTGWKVVSKSAGKMTEAAWQKKAHHSRK